MDAELVAWAADLDSATGTRSVTLSATAAGNLQVAWIAQREGSGSAFALTGTGWVLIRRTSTSPADSWPCELWYREVPIGASATISLSAASNGTGLVVAEWSGVPDGFDVAEYSGAGDTGSATIALDPSSGADVLIVAAVSIRSDSSPTITPSGITSLVSDDLDNGNGPVIGFGYVAHDDAAGPYTVGYTGTTNARAVVAASFIVSPYVAPTYPEYEAPAPGRALLEIWTSDPDGDRWDSALWGTATWADAGWQDVTPQGVDADVSWGTQEPEAGILSRPVAGLWTIRTYDPDRYLDPAYDQSPYRTELVPGLPIRVSHRSLVLRTGIVERIEYEYRDDTGVIRATDAIAGLRGIVPDASALGDTLYDRAEDAIAAAGLGVQVVRNVDDPTLSAEPDGELSAWEHILNAAEERLYLPWITRANALTFRSWAVPLERGRVLSAPELVDLLVISDDDSRYSVVRALDDDGVTTTERAYTPTPAYGKRVYSRTRTTVDSEDWCATVLAERAVPALVYRPGEIRPLTADRVDYFGTIEVGELVTVTTPEIPAISGRVVGGRFRVRWFADAPQWRFAFALAATQTTSLVHDVTGVPLSSDADPTDLLIAG